VGKIAEKAVCRSVFFDNNALYFEFTEFAEFTKTHSSDCIFGDFAHWEFQQFESDRESF